MQHITDFPLDTIHLYRQPQHPATIKNNWILEPLHATGLFIYKYFVIRNIEILGINLVLLKECKDWFGLLYLSAIYRISISACAVILVTHALN